jgi:hypothetical protein
MAKKAKYEAHYLNDIFIEGVLRFPKLNEPDTYGDKPSYKTGIIVEPTKLAALKKSLTEFGHSTSPAPTSGSRSSGTRRTTASSSSKRAPRRPTRSRVN